MFPFPEHKPAIFPPAPLQVIPVPALNGKAFPAIWAMPFILLDIPIAIFTISRIIEFLAARRAIPKLLSSAMGTICGHFKQFAAAMCAE
jgi:hypothetical protein